jgi:hypothetical protein
VIKLASEQIKCCGTCKFFAKTCVDALDDHIPPRMLGICDWPEDRWPYGWDHVERMTITEHDGKLCPCHEFGERP